MANIKDYIKKLEDGSLSLEEQQEAIAKIEETIKIAKQKRDEAVGQKAEMVVSALKQIEDRLNRKYEELLQTPAMVGAQGPQGPAGKDGKDGLNGRDGKDGVDGKDGKDGTDGVDGISVVDARVDFDGGLVMTLSDGSEIDAGQIFSPEVAQNIQIFRGGGGGTSLPDQSGNSGKYLTTDGSALSWATVSVGGGGTVTSVAMTVPTGLTVSGSPITTDGTLAVSYTAGYAIPTTAKQTEWDTAYSWGNHASAGYLTNSAIGTTVQAYDADLTSWASKTAPTGDAVGTTDTQTLTNKRVTNRIGTVADAGTITPTSDSSDQYNVTALAQAATIAAPSGTPTDGQRLTIRLKDNGTGRALTWNGAYRAIGVTLPTTTVASKVTYVGCVYNSQDTLWDVVAVTTQA